MVHPKEHTRSALCTKSRAPDRTSWICLHSFLSRPNERMFLLIHQRVVNFLRRRANEDFGFDVLVFMCVE